MYTVDRARESAARWVGANLARRPGFRGALLHGSICYLDPGARLPEESDIDIVSLWDTAPPPLGKTRFEDAIIDVCGLAVHDVADPERLLADHVFAGTFASRLLVADPDGLLELLGSRSLDRASCKEHFSAMRAAYDEAVQVPDPPARYANHVSAEARSSAIDGTAQSLGDGRHREAMFFTGTCFSKAVAILGRLVPPARLAPHADRFSALIADLSIATVDDRLLRVEAVRRSVPWFRDLTERIIEAGQS